uniref:envelope stress response membrane protein PspC n=1 Tax=Thaumasiovibrio occultus TaxID=1891184 RepID=UPI000B35971C|nr:envelope stress response membrane protein PspC [Thaumasiovibrio occultus]
MINRQLYRDPANGRIRGVCAGLAAYTGIEVWLIRVAAIALLVMSSVFPGVLAYLLVSWILEPMPIEKPQPNTEEFDVKVKQHHWQTGDHPIEVLEKLTVEFEHQEQSLRAMEAYVTSSRFKVDREFSKL